jgi:transcriptional regulator with XRE-family HTH domain
MKDFNTFLQEQFSNKDFAFDYYRQATYFRLADQMILLRKKLGLTQKELAEKAGTTQTVVSRVENVSVHPSLETVIKLAESLGAVVEVRLVELEGIHPAQDKKTGKGKEVQRSLPNFKLLRELVPVKENEEAMPQPVLSHKDLAWSITTRPPLHPVSEKSEIPEFA